MPLFQMEYFPKTFIRNKLIQKDVSSTGADWRQPMIV
jgi:hypothetical protein